MHPGKTRRKSRVERTLRGAIGLLVFHAADQEQLQYRLKNSFSLLTSKIQQIRLITALFSLSKRYHNDKNRSDIAYVAIIIAAFPSTFPRNNSSISPRIRLQRARSPIADFPINLRSTTPGKGRRDHIIDNNIFYKIHMQTSFKSKTMDVGTKIVTGSVRLQLDV